MPKLQKLYTIDVFTVKTPDGEMYNRKSLGLEPMTHQEACAFLSKLSQHDERGFVVVDYPRTDGLVLEIA